MSHPHPHNLLALPLFSALYYDGTTAALNAAEALRQSERIYDLTGSPTQILAAIRFLSALVQENDDPARAAARTEKTTFPLNAQEQGVEKTKTIGHLFNNIPSDDEANYLRGLIKKQDGEVFVCNICVAKALLLRPLFTIGGGDKNLGWRFGDPVFAVPVGASLWETLVWCRPQRPIKSPPWWASNTEDADLFNACRDEAFLYGFHPNRFRFEWQCGICHLCGTESPHTANRLHKHAVPTAETKAERKKILEKIWEPLNKIPEPMLLTTERFIQKHSDIRVVFDAFREGRCAFPTEAGKENGRIIKKAIASEHRRYRYAYLSRTYRVIDEEGGGVIDLETQTPTPPSGSRTLRAMPGQVNYFIAKLLSLSRHECRTLHHDFLSREAQQIVAKTVWRVRRSPFLMFLLTLYVRRPGIGSYTPPTPHRLDAQSIRDTEGVCRAVEQAPREINWYSFAQNLWTATVRTSK